MGFENRTKRIRTAAAAAAAARLRFCWFEFPRVVVMGLAGLLFSFPPSSSLRLTNNHTCKSYANSVAAPARAKLPRTHMHGYRGLLYYSSINDRLRKASQLPDRSFHTFRASVNVDR